MRDFDDVFNNTLFPKLSELNLSGNLFLSTKMLGFLPNLIILILNSNNIETLFSQQDITVKKSLNGCQNLEILDVSNNNLKDFHGFYCRKIVIIHLFLTVILLFKRFKNSKGSLERNHKNRLLRVIKIFKRIGR